MNKTFKAHINVREDHYAFPGYNPEKGVNHPVLFTGMTPVKWGEENNEIETTEDDPDWYDYNEKRWANAKSQDGSYWVWIPRYAYKIETCYHTSGEDCYNLTGKEAGDIDVKFLKGTTNITEDNTTIESAGYVAHEKDTSMYHFLHPAFQFNGEELGFWIAKYEPSVSDQNDECYINASEENCNRADLTTKIMPHVTSWRFINISNAFNVSLEMKNKTDTYGWLPEEIDTHMLTNVEWGAVAYLSKSKYGAHNEEVWLNNSNTFITGCAGNSVSPGSVIGCENEYNSKNGVKSSTTHNIYGVYDMSGGSWELVMGNYNNLVVSSGFVSSQEIASINPKYLGRYYTEPSERLNGIGMAYNLNIYGDGIYETSNNAARYNGSDWEGLQKGSWYSDFSRLPHLLDPWFRRGGRYQDGSSGGVFCFFNSDGMFSGDFTFRPAASPIR